MICKKHTLGPPNPIPQRTSEWGKEPKITMGLPFGAQWPPKAAPRSTIAPQSRQSAPQNPLQHVPHRKIMKKGSPYTFQIVAEP